MKKVWIMIVTLWIGLFLCGCADTKHDVDEMVKENRNTTCTLAEINFLYYTESEKGGREKWIDLREI